MENRSNSKYFDNRRPTNRGRTRTRRASGEAVAGEEGAQPPGDATRPTETEATDRPAQARPTESELSGSGLGDREPTLSGPLGLALGAGLAVDTATDSVDGLRQACLAIEAAVDRAVDSLHDATHPLPRLTLDTWRDALDQAWIALGMVRVGLSEARNLDGVRPASVGDLLGQLRAARQEAEQVIELLAPLRRKLATAEDLARRVDATAAARVTAANWHQAIDRLDLATARLTVGTRALDRYLHNLGDSAPVPPMAPPSPRPRPAIPAETIDTAAGAKAAGIAVLTVHPFGGWRGFLARVRLEYRKENQLRWRKLQRLF